MQRFFLGLTISIASLAGPVIAGELVHTVDAGTIASGATGSFTVPPFDASVGVLRSVSFQVWASIGGRIGFENTTATGWSFGGYQGAGAVMAQVPWEIGGLTGGPPLPVYYPPTTTLPSYDGATDYAGTSGVTFAYSAPLPNGSQMSGGYFDEDANLQTFAGASPVAGQIGPVVRFGPTSSNGLLVTDVMSVSVVVVVRYVYDTTPTSICGAGVWSGCPCGNLSISGPDRGCRNSTGESGALALQGTASLSNDTLAISGAGMTDSNALYFQGTGFRYAQTVYGDGLLCVTGTVLRLATRTNVNGGSIVPSPGGTPISVLGAVTSPGTRYYQVVYRDLGSFCTPSTFNLTSGLAIAWSL